MKVSMRETIIPGVRASTGRDALHLLADQDGRVVARSGSSLVLMNGRRELVLSLVDAFSNQRIEIARVNDIVRVPHMVVMGAHGYFVSDTRRLYGLDLDRLTLSAGFRVEADKVLPLVAVDGEPFLPHVVDTSAGWVTRVSRVVSEHQLGDGLEIAGELHTVTSDGVFIRARGDRALPDHPIGRGFDLAWAPSSSAAPIVTMQRDESRLRPAVRLLTAPTLVVPAHETGQIRPPPRPRELDRSALANERKEALDALEADIGFTLPPLYRELYDLGFADASLRIRLQRIGLVLRHPMFRPRELAARGLIPFADDADATLCLDSTEGNCVPVVRVQSDGAWVELAADFDVFFTSFLHEASVAWPTTVREIRATLGL
jgi:hypothetical protein